LSRDIRGRAMQSYLNICIHPLSKFCSHWSTPGFLTTVCPSERHTPPKFKALYTGFDQTIIATMEISCQSEIFHICSPTRSQILPWVATLSSNTLTTWQAYLSLYLF